MVTRMQQRRGTASQWTAANTVLAAGEIGFETDTNKFKIGNGSTPWNSLPYFLNRNDIEVGLLSTDEVAESTTHLYFTNARAQAAVAGDISSAIGALDTDDIDEGTINLYFTNQRAIDAVGENLALDDLSDVDTIGVADGDALVYDTTTTSWVPGSVAIDALNDIADVNIVDPANGEVLVYDNGNWVNQEASGGGIADIVTESDTTFLVSTIGTVWTTRSSSTSSIAFKFIEYANNLYVATGMNIAPGEQNYAYSTNAVFWTTNVINTFTGTASSNAGLPIAYGNNTWIVASFNGQVASSTNAISWTTRVSNMENMGSINDDINGAAYGNGLFVIVGGGNFFDTVGDARAQIRYSTDAITWQTSAQQTGARLVDVAYGNGEFLASFQQHYPYSPGGEGEGEAPLSPGYLISSTNAVTWTTKFSQPSGSGYSFDRVFYLNNKWVAIGGNGANIAESTNAITWVTRSVPFSGQFIRALDYADTEGIWIVSGTYGNIRTSTNLISWTTQNSNFGNTTILSSTYGNGIFVIGGYSGQIRTSSSIFDTEFVSSKTLSLSDAGDLIQINSAAPTTITIPSNDSVAIPVKTQINFVNAGSGSILFESEKEIVDAGGVTWITRAVSFGQTLLRVNYANNTWVAGGYNSTIATSTDAKNWTIRSNTLQSSDLVTAIVYANGFWYAASNSGGLTTSTDAITWVTRSISFANTGINVLKYANGIIVAGGNSGIIRNSVDGVSWKNINSTFSSNNINSITYGNGIWVAAGNSGQMRISTDSNTWTTTTPIFGAGSINSIEYSDGLFVFGNANGQIARSTDAITWTTSTSNTSQGINGIIYQENQWFAVANGGQLRRSTDAITWTTVNSQFGSTNIRAIAYGQDGQLVAVGQNASIRTSERIETDSVTINTASGVDLSEQWSALELTKVDTDEWLIRQPQEVNINVEDASNNDVLVYNASLDSWQASQVPTISNVQEFSHFGDNPLGSFWVTQTIDVNAVNERYGDVHYANNLWVISGYYSSTLARSSTNATTWTTIPGFFGNINELFFANNVWVGVGNSGLIRRSTDTITWVTQTSNFGSSKVNTVTFGNGVWVAAGSGGQLRTSTDAIAWVTRTSNFGTSAIYTSFFADGIFAIAGEGGQIRTATDGINWVTRTSNISLFSEIRGIAYGLDKWVVVGDSGELRTSTNAITWVTRSSNTTENIRSVDYGDGVWAFSARSGQFRRSTDGITWTTANLGTTTTNTMGKIAYGNGIFISVLEVSRNSFYLSRNYPRSQGYKYLSDANINNLIIANSNSSSVFMLPPNIEAGKSITFSKKTSANATLSGQYDVVAPINWVTRTSGIGSNRVRAIANGGGLWLLGGQNGQMTRSVDGIVWVSTNSNFGTNEITSIVYGDNFWIAGSYGGQIRTATDGINWVTRTSNFGATNVVALDYNAGLIVAGGSAGQLRTSTDGITWVTRTSNFGATQISTIAHGNNVWVAAGQVGQMRRSTDTITWVTVNSNFGSTSINSVAFANNLWVAVGYTQTIRTSTDTITWVTRSVFIDNVSDTYRSVFYGDEVWVAVGEKLIYSTDGTYWDTPQRPVFATVRAAFYQNNLWVIGGNFGLLLNSTPSPVTYTTVYATPGNNLRSAWSVASAISIGNNEWIAVGDLST